MSGNLYIINTPFQLICAQEAVVEFKEKRNTVVILFATEERNNQQIKNILNKKIWSGIIYISGSRNILRRYYNIAKYVRKNTKVFLNIFVGEYRMEVMHVFLTNINYAKAWVLDDGTATIRVQNQIFNCNDGIKLSWRFPFLKKLIFKILGCNLCLSQNVLNLYTIFDLKPIGSQVIIQNELKNLQVTFNKKEDDHVYFIGGNFVEAGEVSLHNYKKLLKYVNNYYPDKIICYFPHRRECRIKLDSLINDFGWRVMMIDEPIEMYITKHALPGELAGFISTALFSIRQLTSNNTLKVTLFRMPENVYENNKSNIDYLYEFASKIFDTIDIPID